MRYLTLLLAPALFLQAQPSRPQSPLARTYREGETLVYRMKGTNEGPGGTLRYEATATGTVQKRTDGNLVECYAWSQVIHNGKPLLLPEASRTFRQMNRPVFLGQMVECIHAAAPVPRRS